MKGRLTLSQYVKKRTGVHMGAKHSMRNMLSRAFGASSFPVFWHYWNPIWSYYLSRNVMRPLSTLLPVPLAIFITFLCSGAIHDLAVSLVKWKTIVFFTPWFGLMGLIVIISKQANISYGKFSWYIRAALNAIIICVSLCLTYFLEMLFT